MLAPPVRDLSGSGTPSAKQGALVAVGDRGPAVMEHLFLDVAAAPLRLLAAKNEKTRSELGRFLAKQVKEGGRGKSPGRSRPPPSQVPCGPELDALLEGKRVAAFCHPDPLPRAGGQGRRRPRVFEEIGRKLLCLSERPFRSFHQPTTLQL